MESGIFTYLTFYWLYKDVFYGNCKTVFLTHTVIYHKLMYGGKPQFAVYDVDQSCRGLHLSLHWVCGGPGSAGAECSTCIQPLNYSAL